MGGGGNGEDCAHTNGYVQENPALEMIGNDGLRQEAKRKHAVSAAPTIRYC
jgi:hypothetical protein